MIGQTLQEYLIEAELAVTSTGTVYQVQHTLLKVPRAIKIIHPQLASKDTIRKRVQLAIQSWANLDHPNFLNIFESIDEVNYFGFVMDYIPGASLRELLQSQGKLGISQAIDYFLQIAKGLAFAHEHQILHRKLAPENIKICKDETIKIMGLGALRDWQMPKITPENLCVGKVKYMAPEQFQGNYSPYSDQYTLGIILYEMVTGQVPYQGKTLAELYKMHLMETPVPPKKINTEISNELQKIILRMIAKKPQDRFPNLNDVIAALNEATDRIDFSNDVSLSSLMSKARRALERRNLEIAIYHFNKVLSIYGYKPQEAQEALTKRKQAFFLLQEEDDIRNIRDLTAQALSYYDEEQHDEARKYVTKIIEVMRNHPDSSRIRGLKMDLAHEMPDIVSKILAELEINLNNARISVENAQKLIEDGQYHEADTLLQEALNFDPKNEVAFRLSKVVKRKIRILQVTQCYRDGLLHIKNKAYKNAIDAFEKVLAVAPEHTDAQLYLKKARESLEKDKKRRMVTEQFYREGRDLYEKCEYREAMDRFEKVLGMDQEQDFGDTKILLSQVQERMEDDQRLEQISLFYNKGQEFYKVRKWKEAIACFNRVLGIMSSHKNALHYKKLAEDELTRESQFQEIFSHGVSLFQANQYKAALEKFNSLAQLDATNSDVKRYRRLCLEFIGQRQAKEEIES